MLRISALTSILLSLAVVGCSSSDSEPASQETGDGRDDSFNTGKADGFSVEEGSAAALAVLQVANTATFETLDSPVAQGGAGLEVRAAQGIVSNRPFESLAELDAVPYVGPVTLELLHDYAVTAGMVGTSFSCSYDETWYFDNSERMEDFIIATLKVTQSTQLTELQKGQLQAAVVHLDLMDSTDGMDAVWDAADDDFFELHFMDFGYQADWIKFYAGDTEVGVVFEPDTTKIVAEVSDGDVLGCGVSVTEPISNDPNNPPVEPAVCSYDTPWYFDSTEDMGKFASQSVLVDQNAELTTLQRAQIWATAMHLSFVQEGDDFSKVWEASDDAMFEFKTVDSVDQLDWIRFYAGDTEVGVVFHGGTSLIVAEVSDGDVLGCGVERPQEVSCSYTHDWEFLSSDNLEAAATNAVVLTPSSSLTALQRDQLRNAATHLTFMSYGDDFSKVWDASDDESFELIRVEAEEDYDWVRFYAGDTEVGVVFVSDTASITGEISDGDVLYCQ